MELGQRVNSMPKKRSALLSVAGIALVSLLLSACSSSPSTPTKSQSSVAAPPGKALTGTLTIAGLTDLGYAPLYLMAQEGWLKQAMPHVHTTFEFLSSGAAVESAVLSGNIDIAALGIAPFLLGWNSGINWKILSGFGPVNEDLVTWNSAITSLHDITPSDRIATLAPTSIQAIALKKAALATFGNANALDKNEVSLSHAVAYQSWLSHTITADFSAVPFQDEEIAHGGHVITTLFKIMHSTITPNVVAVEQTFYNSHKAEMQIVYRNIQRALTMLSRHPNQSARVIARYEHGTITEANVKGSIDNPALSWSTAPQGIMAYARFMKSIHLMTKTLTTWKQVVYPNLYGLKGS